jgi:hypothetical protein
MEDFEEDYYDTEDDENSLIQKESKENLKETRRDEYYDEFDQY